MKPTNLNSPGLSQERPDVNNAFIAMEWLDKRAAFSYTSHVKTLENYLRELYMIHATGAGVKETSYYPALANLLNAVGATLKPKVRCIIHLQNRGAGIPDGGLFAQEQLQRADEGAMLAGQNPARGVIEVKGTGEPVRVTAQGAQVAKYLAKYRQVLVTNYHDFALVVPGTDGFPSIAEEYRLAESEAAFWKGAANASALAQEHGDRLSDYLKRVMLRPAPLTSPEDVAWFLASYVREAKGRIERANLPALGSVRAALEQSLGLTFEGEKGEHFFRSTLIQTLFYGVFSAFDGFIGNRRQNFWIEAVLNILLRSSQITSGLKPVKNRR